MSSQGSPTLDLDVRARRIERRIASIALAAAVLSPWLLREVDMRLLVLFSLAAGLCTAVAFWRAGWIGSRHRVTRITWLADGRWIVAVGGELSFEAALSGHTRRGAGFAWLRWQAPHSRSMLLVEPDLAPGELRRLLVRLAVDRLGGPPLIGLLPVGARAVPTRATQMPIRPILCSSAGESAGTPPVVPMPRR